jgi:phospholipid-binding lipoprotein MlaA
MPTILLRLLTALAISAALGACATVPPNAGKNPADPWERYNRHVSEFNDQLDAAVLRPVAKAYATVVPTPVRDCVTNFFTNVADVPSSLNNVLQAKPTEAATDLCRVAINTTIGLLGCFDVASRMGLQRTDEDFGQTLGYWGAGPGPFLVWPLLGPSTVRDSVGRVAGFYTNPINYIPDVATRNILWGTGLIDTRANLLSLDRLLDGALDRYQFIRDAYLQRRRNLVYDGNPPRVKDEEDE